MRGLSVGRDNMPLHVLAGVPREVNGMIVELLKAEPELWPIFGPWLALHDPVGWREFVRMAAEQKRPIVLDFSPLTQYLRQVVDRAHLKTFMETVGVKEVMEAVGVEQTLEAIGEEQFWANLSPERREKLRRLVQQDNPSPNEPTG